jgi:hypothetical protein
MTPEISSTQTSPSAIATTVRPCLARASPRVRPPGSTTVQPSRSPVPAATKTAVSSSSPCGVMSPKKTSPRPAATIRPAATPRLVALTSRISTTGTPSSTPSRSAPAATQALLVHTCAANDAAGFDE